MGEINNAAIENILSRRSVRKYDESRVVDQKTIETLIECASAAPSAHNLRPCHFIIITDRQVLCRLSEEHPFGKMLATAAFAVAVCGETQREAALLDYWEEDCSAAMENLLLAANAVGLASVWLGVRHGPNGLEAKMKGLLEVPGNIAMLGIASIGYPVVTVDPHKGIAPTSLHANKW
ncbi:MAG: nitroreductase family protein [Synergistaceae bacterium]|nr:nitroreductase family protein [Synergistaceae bacterium]